MKEQKVKLQEKKQKLLIQLQNRTYIMDSTNLQNCAWVYVHKDDWDQDGVFLETWFLADYDIQTYTDLLSYKL